MEARTQDTNRKPRYVNNAQIHKPVQAPAPEPTLPALAPSQEPRPGLVYVYRHGQLRKLQYEELTRKEREDLEAAQRRAAYCSLFNIYEMYG